MNGSLECSSSAARMPTEEEKRAEIDAKWLLKKSSLIYDYEDDTIDFSRIKPTEWNGNKRILKPANVL